MKTVEIKLKLGDAEGVTIFLQIAEPENIDLLLPQIARGVEILCGHAAVSTFRGKFIPDIQELAEGESLINLPKVSMSFVK